MNTRNEQTNCKTTFTKIKALTAGMLLALAVSLPASSLAQAKPDHSGHQGHEMKAPQTAQEHRARAKEYREKAEAQRQDAETHKQMLADYSKGVAKNPKDTGENPYVKKMRLHCQKYIKAAEALAYETEEMAKFHEMRAKEMEGK
jgi:hypothetical protein